MGKCGRGVVGEDEETGRSRVLMLIFRDADDSAVTEEMLQRLATRPRCCSKTERECDPALPILCRRSSRRLEQMRESKNQSIGFPGEQSKMLD